MSTYPRLEARVSALERRQTQLDARIEEVTEDTSTSLQQSSKDIEKSFNQFTEYLTKIEEQNDERFTAIEKRLDRIEAVIATKEDIKAITSTLSQHTAILTQILELLPKNEI